VRTDITLFLYSKTLIAFRRDDSAVHQGFIRNALTAQHIGCFGLTEIGHGSDTKNIQTEAVYEHPTRSFTLNTPSEAALKFWIGGAAETATHGVIWAQLVIKGKKYGMHPFIAPLRDRKTMEIY
jgi:acyl-CoA oxidase